MYFTLSLKDVLVALLFIALIIFVIYLIQLMRKLIMTVTKSNELLDDLKVMTDIAEKRSLELDHMIDNISGSVIGMTEAIKGNENLIKQLSAIAKAVTSIVGIIKNKKEED